MTPFAEYLAAIRKKLAQGDATEQTHRAALEHLLEAVGKGITATNEPKRIACGAPDFNITRHKVPLGHIETKDIGISLDDMERGKGANGEQFKRYRDALPNWILTDYLEFRWFVAGEKRLTVRLAESDGSGKVRALPEGEQRLAVLLDSFFTAPALTVGTAKELAERMAGMTRNLRDLITATFAHGAAQEKDWLQNWLTSFREVLIPDLDEPQFADMFAQTLAYGLFAARVHAPADKTFSREMAAFSLPKTNPFLRKLFAEFAGVDMPETFGWAVDDIVDLLKHAEMDEVLKDFGKGRGKEDPVVHFYETFLAAYDPRMRKLRGVFYTPEPAVSYIVRSIDYLLRTRLNRSKGLADENTLILDPATGTATFLYFVVQQIYEQFVGQKGAWDSYVSKHLLSRLFGFELLMAPYAIAHLKLGMELQETGYSFASDQRLGIYLTNTLEEAAKKSEKLFAQWISEEANAAARIKRDLPIMVVLGNPPYSNFGRMNRGKWIRDLIEDYKSGLQEKKLNLDDDFIKFIRFAQWRIDRTGAGILAFISNNTYIDGITHRRMRQSLMESFSEIYILDLHGSTVKNEKCPDGTKDENVFDIRQGVAIGIFVKQPERKSPTKVRHAELWGLRESKYARLFGVSTATIEWDELHPKPPYFFFVPKESSADKDFGAARSLREIFIVGQNGVKTDRDDLFYDFDRDSLSSRIQKFYSDAGMESDFRETYHIEDSSSYPLLSRREETDFSPANILECLFRPFDLRWVYYSPGLTSRPGWAAMRHMLAGENIALCAMRQSVAERFGHILVSREINDLGVLVSHHASQQTFPLYLYPTGQKASRGQPNLNVETSAWPSGPGGRKPNLNPEIIADLEKRLGLLFASDGKGDLQKTFGPEDVFNYIYALLHSPTYRKRYAEFLKSDFPRLPLTSDRSLFIAIAGKGNELVALHVMESPKLDQLITTFPERGSNVVEKVTYIDATQRVCINGIQYFQGVARDAWEFHVGGYQVLEKWLKDRKGRELTWDDTQRYQKVVVALKETIRLMAEIDAVIEAHGGWPLQ